MMQDLTEGQQEELLEMLEEQQYEEMLNESEEMAEQIETLAKAEGIGGQLEIDFTAQYVQITLNGAVLFEPAEADVKEKALPLISKVGDILKNYSSNMVEITGHTDNVPLLDDPKYDDNWDLSSAFNITAMFRGCESLKSISALKNWAASCRSPQPTRHASTSSSKSYRFTIVSLKQ